MSKRFIRFGKESHSKQEFWNTLLGMYIHLVFKNNVVHAGILKNSSETQIELEIKKGVCLWFEKTQLMEVFVDEK